MRKLTRGAVAWLILSLSLAQIAAAEGWRLVEEEAPITSGAAVQETVWQAMVGDGAHDRIGLHRYRGQGVEGGPIAALLYLPGTNMNGAVALEDERHNLWLYVAGRGVEVFALDYRTHSVPADDLEDGGFMRDWTTESFVADAARAAKLVREQTGLPLFVAGFSRGVTLAYAFVSRPDAGEIAGLVALDGAFKSARGESAFDHTTAVERLRSGGFPANDVAAGIGWETRDRLMQAAAADPAGPATSDEHATIGEQVATLLHNAWRPGGLSNTLDGKSRPEVLARLLAGYDRYYPSVQDVDGRAIADYDDAAFTELDDRWGELELPILYFGATRMGSGWILDGVYSAVASGSKDVTLNVLEDYGHLDVLVGEEASQEVFEPLWRWIAEHAGGR